MVTAAVALTLGYTDPLGLLGLERHDWAVAVAAIKKADELRSERDQQLAQATAVMTANSLAPMLSKTIAQIARAMRG